MYASFVDVLGSGACGAVVAKDAERKALVEFIRSVARQIQADPDVSDSSKTQAGLPVRSSSRTPAPVPTTSPVVTIEPTQVQEHTLRLMDGQNPHRRSRPQGVMSCEVIGFVGNSHPAEVDFKPFGLTTRMHKVVSFPATESAKLAGTASAGSTPAGLKARGAQPTQHHHRLNPGH